MDTHTLLQHGIASAQAGDRKNEVALLAQVVQADPASELGWLWLAKCLVEPDRRAYCLRRVLALNSANSEAAQLLQGAARSTTPQALPTSAAPTAPPMPAPAAVPVEQSQPPRRRPLWVGLAGLALGLLCCAGPIVIITIAGGLDPWLAPLSKLWPVTPVPTATPTLLMPAQLGLTPVSPDGTATAVPASSTKPDGVEPEYTRAWNLMAAEKWSEAIPLWDQVIAKAPGFAEPYFQRGRAYYELTANQRSQAEYFDYLERARRDLDQTLALFPERADGYLYRYYVYNQLADNQPYQVDRDSIKNIALQNLQLANRLGTLDELAVRNAALLLIDLGRCEEGLAETERLMAAAPAPSAGLNTILSLGYLCQGRLDLALKYIDVSLQLYPNLVRRWHRAVILFDLGRSQEALDVLNESITQSPNYNGYRYFLRSVIYADLGQWNQAEADVQAGQGETWDDWSIAAYAQARLAAHRGDRAEAVRLLQYAEATMARDYGPLIDRIRQELRAAGGQPASPTPANIYAATPIPDDLFRPGGTTP